MKKLLFFMMFFVFNVTCYAAHLDLEAIPNVYGYQHDLSKDTVYTFKQNRFIMDGRLVYCTRPGVDIMTREYSSSDDLSLSSISPDILNKMELISYYAYDYPMHKSDVWFMAGQELIWELLGQDVHFTTGANNSGRVHNIDYEKWEIMHYVDNYDVLPSFSDVEVSGVLGDTITLYDTNYVLDSFDIVSSNNSVSIDMDKLVIHLDKLGSDTIHFVKHRYDDENSKYYYADGSQDFMFLRPSHDVSFDLNVKAFIPKTSISVYKKGEVLTRYDDGFVYEEKGLSSVEYGVFANSDISYNGEVVFKSGDLVSTFVTHDGFGSSIDLPNGSYILRELNTIDGYVLDDNDIFIELNNLDKESDDYMVELVNERQKIMLNLKKVGEEFDGVVDSVGKFNSIPLEGISFGLYNSSPIYSYDNEQIVLKDTLIDTFVTDSDGSISALLDIPYGSYYVKELSTLDGYKIDPNIYEFSVIKNGDDTNILITKEPIVNELIKGNLVIHKMDTDGNNLSDVRFKIFDDFNNLIYDGVTDENGLISISNLGYGKYHFYETSAPNGYFLDDKLYEFVITDDNELINIKVVNEKLPITSNVYEVPKRLSTIGLGFGLATLSLAIVYDKKRKNC